jgi:DnaK suppressor protein
VRAQSGEPEPLDLRAVERELRSRSEKLQERLADLARPPERGAELGFGKRIGDGTTEAVSRLNEVGVGASLEVSEKRIARALTKLAPRECTSGRCDGGAASAGSHASVPQRTQLLKR